MKFRKSIHENVELIVATILKSAQAGADVVLFPECAVTGYHRDFSTLKPSDVRGAQNQIAAAARQAQCHVLVGCPTFAGPKRLNSLLVYNRRGQEVFCYSKIHLTPRDADNFQPGNRLAFFRLEGIPCTAILCHERRFPELVRIPAMLGAQIVFHPNAGLDTLPVSRTKRGGRDGIAVRAVENQIFYAFANSVGPQGDQWWSAGDSKIVAPDSRVLALANNRDEMVVQAQLDLSEAGRKYAREALIEPKFLRSHWQAMLAACRQQLR